MNDDNRDLLARMLEKLAQGVRAGTASVERVEVSVSGDYVRQNGGLRTLVRRCFEVRIDCLAQSTPLDEATLRELPVPVMIEVTP